MQRNQSQFNSSQRFHSRRILSGPPNLGAPRLLSESRAMQQWPEPCNASRSHFNPQRQKRRDATLHNSLLACTHTPASREIVGNREESKADRGLTHLHRECIAPPRESHISMRLDSAAMAFRTTVPVPVSVPVPVPVPAPKPSLLFPVWTCCGRCRLPCALCSSPISSSTRALTRPPSNVPTR